MADEDLASQEADDGARGEDAALADNQQQDNTPEPIANLARDLGWTPREEWQGEPEKWKPAEQFIRDGREMQQTSARELRNLREQMDRFANVAETLAQDRVATARAQWEAELTKAVDDGDTERALTLARQEPRAKPNGNAPDPTVQQWVAKNPWFTSDPLAQARAQELSDRLKHLPVPDQLAQVERAIRKEFPEHFPAPAKQPPGVQTGQSRNPNPSNRAKGYADMPAASQQVALEFERLNGVPKEDFAKQYWANEAKKGSRA